VRHRVVPPSFQFLRCKLTIKGLLSGWPKASVTSAKLTYPNKLKKERSST
jgi:hypothetical protein